jgi:hypothetical protein
LFHLVLRINIFWNKQLRIFIVTCHLSMHLPPVIYTAFAMSFLIACHTAEDKAVTIIPNNILTADSSETQNKATFLAHKVLTFRNGFDRKSCSFPEEVRQTKYFSFKILIVDTNTFVSMIPVSFRLTDTSFNRGNYRLTDTSIELSFSNRIVAKHYNPKKDIELSNTTIPTYFIETELTESFSATFKIDSCRQLIFYANKKYVGYIDTSITLERELSRLKSEGIWKQLDQQ